MNMYIGANMALIVVFVLQILLCSASLVKCQTTNGETASGQLQSSETVISSDIMMSTSSSLIGLFSVMSEQMSPNLADSFSDIKPIDSTSNSEYVSSLSEHTVTSTDSTSIDSTSVVKATSSTCMSESLSGTSTVDESTPSPGDSSLSSSTLSSFGMPSRTDVSFELTNVITSTDTSIPMESSTTPSSVLSYQPSMTSSVDTNSISLSISRLPVTSDSDNSGTSILMIPSSSDIMQSSSIALSSNDNTLTSNIFQSTDSLQTIPINTESLTVTIPSSVQPSSSDSSVTSIDVSVSVSAHPSIVQSQTSDSISSSIQQSEGISSSLPVTKTSSMQQPSSESSLPLTDVSSSISSHSSIVPSPTSYTLSSTIQQSEEISSSSISMPPSSLSSYSSTSSSQLDTTSFIYSSSTQPSDNIESSSSIDHQSSSYTPTSSIMSTESEISTSNYSPVSTSVATSVSLITPTSVATSTSMVSSSVYTTTESQTTTTTSTTTRTTTTPTYSYPTQRPNLDSIVFAISFEITIQRNFSLISNSTQREYLKDNITYALKSFVFANITDVFEISFREGSIIAEIDTNITGTFLDEQDITLQSLVIEVTENFETSQTVLEDSIPDLDFNSSLDSLEKAKDRIIDNACSLVVAEGACSESYVFECRDNMNHVCKHRCDVVENPCGEHGVCFYDTLTQLTACRCTTSSNKVYHGSRCEDSTATLPFFLAVSLGTGAGILVIAAIIIIVLCYKNRNSKTTGNGSKRSSSRTGASVRSNEAYYAEMYIPTMTGDELHNIQKKSPKLVSYDNPGYEYVESTAL